MTDTITPAEAAALARIREGWVVVPREPTKVMWDAINAADNKAFAWGNQHGATFEELWAIALDIAAAPEADSHDD